MATHRRGKNSFVVQVNVPKETHGKLQELSANSNPPMKLSKFCAGILIQAANAGHIGTSRITYAPAEPVNETGKQVGKGLATVLRSAKSPKKTAQSS